VAGLWLEGFGIGNGFRIPGFPVFRGGWQARIGRSAAFIRVRSICGRETEGILENLGVQAIPLPRLDRLSEWNLPAG